MNKNIIRCCLAVLLLAPAGHALANPTGGFANIAAELGFVNGDSTQNGKLNLTYGMTIDGGYSIKNILLGANVAIQVANTIKLGDTTCTVVGKSQPIACSKTYSKVYIPVGFGASYSLDIGDAFHIMPGLYGGFFVVNESIMLEASGDIAQINGPEFTSKTESSTARYYGLIMPTLSMAISVGSRGELNIGGRLYIVPNGPEKQTASDYTNQKPFIYSSVSIGYRQYF
ncbi:MAG: hypothetical protein QM529_07375 [Hydrotalea sp.]|nr:hypothetical protein [Hydrotalea sp.]MDI9314475.1 hypothetical protein [Hydrotalea sp.]